MMVARWSVDAKFGHKHDVIEMLQRWMRDIGPKAGFNTDKTRLLTGSIGAREATVQTEHMIEDLAELNQVWDKLVQIPEHKQWGKDLEPLVVSGSSRWKIYRVL